MAIDPASVETNVLYIDVDASAEAVAREARALGVLVGPSAARRLRAVTHLDVARADVDIAADVLAEAVDRARRARPSSH
jgi:threonine aldolase